MWRFLVGFFVAIGVLALAFFGVITFLAVESVGKIEKAAAFADETVAAYSVAWDETALLDRASPEFMDAVRQNPDTLSQLSQLMKNQGGALVSKTDATCPNFQSAAATQKGAVFVAGCEVRASLERSEARFQVNVVQRDGAWRLLGFFAFLEPRESGGPVLVSYRENSDAPAVGAGMFVDIPVQMIGVSLADQRISYGAGDPAVIDAGVGARRAGLR